MMMKVERYLGAIIWASHTARWVHLAPGYYALQSHNIWKQHHAIYWLDHRGGVWNKHLLDLGSLNTCH